MPQINATVTWDVGQNKGTVSDIQVPETNGSSVIQWTCGPNVASFAISGLDPTEFTPSGSNGQVTTFTTTDKNDNSNTYSYTVTAVHEDGRTSSHDPKIENGT